MVAIGLETCGERMTTFIIRDEKRLQNCLQHLVNESMGQEVTIGPIRKSRQQEAFWHACVKVISDYIGETPEETKLRLKYEFLPLKSITDLKGKPYLYPQETRSLDKKTYSELIDRTLMLGASLQLKMPTPDYYGLQITKEEK